MFRRKVAVALELRSDDSREELSVGGARKVKNSYSARDMVMIYQ